MAGSPRMPDAMLMRYTDVPEGRMRSRMLGERRPGAPPVVVVQGMAVSDYLLPACAALGEWTQAFLVDLPGYAGSGQPTRYLDVRGYGEAVAHWLEAVGLDRAVVVGHSSGTQLAAWAGVLCQERVAAMGLASPTVDPMARSLPRLVLRWRLDGRYRPRVWNSPMYRSGSAPASAVSPTWSRSIWRTGWRSRWPG